MKYRIAVASETGALLIALMALRVGASDEVVTSPFIFISTVETISLLGAKLVFVDIDSRTYKLDPSLLESTITLETWTVLPVIKASGMSWVIRERLAEVLVPHGQQYDENMLDS